MLKKWWITIQMTRIINIAGNSGAGKSIVALNLGVALATQGRDVTLIDGNLYSPDIANYSDIKPNAFLNEFLDGQKNFEDILHYHPSGLKVIPAIAEDSHNDGKFHTLNRALLHLVGKSEIVLVDSFSHSPLMFSVMDNADETLFITNDDYPSIIKSKEFINKIESKGLSVMGILLNKRMRTQKDHVESIVGKRVLAELPYDKKMIEAINIKQPVYLSYPKSKISRSLSELAKLLDVSK